MRFLLAIALAGAAGTLARHGINQLVSRWLDESFPWATLFVNALGCFLFGLTWSLVEQRQQFSNETRTILLTGFMGAFTTYSTFAFDTAQFLHGGQWILASANVGAQLVLGLAALFVGLAVGR